MHDTPNTRPRVPLPFLRSIGRALSSRNFLLFFMGQGVSLIGTWMTRIATVWLVYRVGNSSEILLGVVSFMGQVPAFFLGPFAGVYVDRGNRRRILILTQVLSLIQSALLGVVAFSDVYDSTIATIMVLSVCQGLINAFDMPARQAFLFEMVDKREDLANAIALNSSLVNGARLVGPSLAGLLIWAAGSEGWCFMIDAVSYVAVIFALLAMRVTPRERSGPKTPLWQGLREGFQYAFGFAPIRSILTLLALVSFTGMPYTVLMPVFASQILGGGPRTLGFLSAATGLGALAGALYLASRSSVLGLGRIIAIATLIFGVGLLAFSQSTTLWVSLVILLFVGFGMMVQMAASNTILQTIVSEEMRGRVMSFYTMAFLGVTPFGSLFAGVVAEHYGAPTTVLIGGITCIFAAAFFAYRLKYVRAIVRPIYTRMGIIPEIAFGIQSAAEMTRAPEK